MRKIKKLKWELLERKIKSSFLKLMKLVKAPKKTLELGLYHGGIKCMVGWGQTSRPMNTEQGQGWHGRRQGWVGPHWGAGTPSSCRLLAACWAGLQMSRSLSPPHTASGAEGWPVITEHNCRLQRASKGGAFVLWRVMMMNHVAYHKVIESQRAVQPEAWRH